METHFKMVLITGCAPEHCYVANRLASAFPIEAILIDVGAPISRQQRLKRIRRHTPSQFLSRALLKSWMGMSRDHLQRRKDMEAVLGEDSLSHRFPVRAVPGINSQDTIATLSKLSPDILLIYGTAVAGPKVLNTAKMALNLHFGMSPRYRGTNCVFWPLYFREPDQLGATVHFCTEQVDGGSILAQARVRLRQEDDTIHKVFARVVESGASLYQEAIRRVEAGYRGEPQDLSAGREYGAVMWGIMQEWRVRQQIRKGLVVG
jgi:methionyl-tRNA formyltransferase